MDHIKATYTNASGTLQYHLSADKKIVMSAYGSLRGVSNDEYLAYLGAMGKCMEHYKIGKIYVDFSKLEYYSITLRAAAINNLNELMLKRAPFFCVALVKSKSTFENLALQTALNAAIPLSKKFLDGKLFDSEAEAMKWLTEYPVPPQFETN